MKAWTTVCALAALALSATTTTVVRAEECNLIKIFDLIKPLETDENVTKCIAATGFELLPPPGAPTKEQVDKLCADSSCKAVFASLQKMAIPDCTISMLGGVNMKKVLNEAFGQCSASTAAATTPAPAAAATPAPAATSAPAATPAVTPAAVPAVTPAAATTAAPAAASKAPVPTPAASSPGAKATGKTKNCHA